MLGGECYGDACKVVSFEVTFEGVKCRAGKKLGFLDKVFSFLKVFKVFLGF